jgi:hypothetical protein
VTAALLVASVANAVSNPRVGPDNASVAAAHDVEVIRVHFEHGGLAEQRAEIGSLLTRQAFNEKAVFSPSPIRRLTDDIGDL